MPLGRILTTVLRPFRAVSRARADLADVAAAARQARPIQARYAAAEYSDEMAMHWGHADALDADASNSLAVRKRAREHSRLERANNGYAAGVVRTHANYVVGRGPSLRMETANPAFNAMVEERWRQWAKAVGLGRKLRTACKAKTGDGEAFIQIVTNPRVAHKVKLDLRPLECDQVSSPWVPYQDEGRIDGVRFDQWGNPLEYEVLRYHPGGLLASRLESRMVPARFMCHWYQEDRPQQHRGVPECISTLPLCGKGRRYREAVIAAAETAADFAAVLEMGAPNNEPDEVRPFSSIPIERRMMVATPAGAKLAQMRAEQPTTTYEAFSRSIVAEEARPMSMPFSIAGCDSRGNSFSGTQNDHLIYYQAVDPDRADCEEMALDKIFAVWFEEAAETYGWAVPATPAPRHGWNWPPMPQVDAEKAADADKAELGLGVPPSVIASRRGHDFDDWVAQGAKDYGISEAEYRAKIFDSNFAQPGAAAPKDGGNGDAKNNGNGSSASSNGKTPPSRNGNGQSRFAGSM